MKTCPSCGGIIGRDCFNPDECALITMRMESDERRNNQLRLHELEAQVRDLQGRLMACEEKGPR